MRTAAAAPAGGAMVALAAHLLGLVRGERSLAELPLFGGTLLDGRQGERRTPAKIPPLHVPRRAAQWWRAVYLMTSALLRCPPQSVRRWGGSGCRGAPA
jgi:hypothetical protein